MIKVSGILRFTQACAERSRSNDGSRVNRMWFFKCPEFFFGEDALSQLEMLSAKHVFIVTDANIARLGFADLVQKTLADVGIDSQLFTEVEPDQ